MPIYNQPELVVRALDSIPRREDIEVIAVNDGSTDNTLSVLIFYKNNHPDLNLRVVSYEENKGIGHAKNIGYDLATGEYLYQLDCDDYLYTEEFLKALSELDGTDMVYVNLRINDGTIFALSRETHHGYCAGYTRFVRREFFGDRHTREDIWSEDWYMNEELLSEPHTEKYTNLIAYHYNFPREGSLYWEATHGIQNC